MVCCVTEDDLELVMNSNVFGKMKEVVMESIFSAADDFFAESSEGAHSDDSESDS